MNPVRWVLVVFCLAVAATLVAIEAYTATRPPAAKPQTGDEVRGSGFVPGSDLVEKLADKSPRIAAALSFVLLAAVFGKVLELSVAS